MYISRYTVWHEMRTGQQMASDLHIYNVMQIQNHGHMLVRPRAEQPTYKCCLHASIRDKKPSWYVTVKTTRIFMPFSNPIHQILAMGSFCCVERHANTTLLPVIS